MAPGTGITAFFDLDHTVLTHSSAVLWARYLHREGWLSWWRLVGLAWWTLLYRLALMDMTMAARLMAADMRGQNEAELIEQASRWFVEMVRPCIAAAARQRINEHLAQGHTVALLTASTPYVSRPVAEDLGLGDRYVCTRLEVQDGHFTGRCVEPICYGPGKVHWARAFCAERGLDLERSFFYTDSYTDLHMLTAVSHPIAVNPDTRLRRYARRRGWPIERFF